MRVNISDFKNNLGPEADKIMEHCLGKDWKNVEVKESREMFNLALSINLEGDDNVVVSALVIRDAYYLKFPATEQTYLGDPGF
jgi:hypothetical protein